MNPSYDAAERKESLSAGFQYEKNTDTDGKALLLFMIISYF